MPTTTDTGYTTQFCLPILPPDKAITDITAYYNGLNVLVDAINNDIDGIEYTYTGASVLKVYAMTAGSVTFIPPKGLLPDGSNSKEFGTIVINPGPLEYSEVNKTLQGVPTPSYILYSTIKPESFRLAIKNYLITLPEGSVTQSVEKRRIDYSWKHTQTTDPSTESFNTKLEKFLDRILTGTIGVWVDCATELGEIEEDANGNIKLNIKFVDKDNLAISPVSYLKNISKLTKYSESKFDYTADPQIKALNFDLQMDFYIKFESWNPKFLDDETLVEYIQVDENIEVKLMGFDSSISDYVELSSKLTDLNGSMHFNLKYSDIIGKNDIYFKISREGVFG